MTDHKSGKLKQTNKKHKGRTSKRFQKESFGAGKVASRKGTSSSNYARDLVRDSRNNRLNKAKQLQKSKRSEIWLQQRIGANDGPPKVVGIVPLSADTNVFSVLQECLREASWSDGKKAAADGSHHIVNALYLKYKARCSFVLADSSLSSALDVARVADILVLVVDGGASQEFVIDQNGNTTLSALKAIGLGTPLCCVQNLPPKKHKTYTQTKRMVQRVAESYVEVGVKVIEDNGSAFAAGSTDSSAEEMDTENDAFVPGKSSFSATQPASEMTRAIVACTVKEVSWRSTRSTVLGDSLELLDCLPEAPESNRIRVTGFLRGAPLYMHSLVHILGVNTCTLESVEVGGDPLTAASRRLKGQSQRSSIVGGDGVGGAGVAVYRADPSKQDSLVMESTPDTLMGEQTWPSEEELLQTSSGDGMAGRDQRHVPTSIPAGMSSYQADWYVDEKGNFEPEYEEVQEEAASTSIQIAEEEDGHDMQGSDDDDGDDNMTLDGSILNMAQFPGASTGIQPKKSKLKQAQEDDEFPDEVDTPEDVAARVRFARYRNLQSFRTSPWHPKENLPADYSRIYQFENFNMAQRAAINHLKAVRNMQDSQKLESRAASVATSKASRSRASSFATTGSEVVMEEDVQVMGGMGLGGEMNGVGVNSGVIRGAEEFIPTGQYVSIVLSNVSPAVVEAYQTQGFVALFSLLPHENKLSVMHFTVERCDGYDEPIKSKEDLIFQVGFRTFTGRPIFSEINLNCDKHKMERFFRKGSLSMASVYGPVTFLPCPLLMFKQHEVTGKMVLVAKGALSAIDPDRIMLKKVILTGIPIRVRKRSAVVRQLFYDPQDVRWFKPAELVTKFGIRGHIKEPIGTHGLLKAQFGAPIKQNDTVMLILYKRMFPKFSDETSCKVVCL